MSAKAILLLLLSLVTVIGLYEVYECNMVDEVLNTVCGDPI